MKRHLIWIPDDVALARAESPSKIFLVVARGLDSCRPSFSTFVTRIPEVYLPVTVGTVAVVTTEELFELAGADTEIPCSRPVPAWRIGSTVLDMLEKWLGWSVDLNAVLRYRRHGYGAARKFWSSLGRNA